MVDFETTMASSGLTAAAIAVIYAGIKILQRIRCSSHNKCCDFSISRAETQRQISAEVLELVMAKLKEAEEEGEKPEGEQLV